MKPEEKPLPKIATRCLLLLDATQKEAMNRTVRDAAESIGLNIDDGWKIKSDATAFVRNGKPEKPEPETE